MLAFASDSRLHFVALLAAGLGVPAHADDLDGTTASVIRAGDIDRDGIEDVLVLGRGRWRGQLLALRMPTFEVLWSTLDSNPCFGENIEAMGDFDGDGLPDFAVGTDGLQSSVNVALISGATGEVILRKPGFRRAAMVPTTPPSWLMMRSRGPTSYAVPDDPSGWVVVEDTSPYAVIRIDPRTDEVLTCYSDADASARHLNGWTGTAVPTRAGLCIALTGKGFVRICTLDGTCVQELHSRDERDEFPWSLTTPPAASTSSAHLIVSAHHLRCDVVEPGSWRVASTILGCNVTGVQDAFASSVDAYYEPTAHEPTVVVGAAEMWAEAFDEGYLTLSRPGESKPLVLLDNREIGYHACFIGDLNGDGTREIFAVEVSPTKENGCARKETVGAFVLDGRDGHVLSKGLVRFQQPQRKPSSR